MTCSLLKYFVFSYSHHLMSTFSYFNNRIDYCVWIDLYAVTEYKYVEFVIHIKLL